MDELEILRGLLEEYSPSGHEEGAARKFVELAESLGLRAHIDEAGNAIARTGGGRPEIIVIGAVGEERDSRGARHLLPRHRPDFLIVGEPSGWDGVTVGYKGNLSLVLRLDGERGHLSSPTATTIETALTFVERLRAFCNAHAGLTPFHSLTMKTRSINTTQSGGEEHVEIGLNLRLQPGLDLDE